MDKFETVKLKYRELANVKMPLELHEKVISNYKNYKVQPMPSRKKLEQPLFAIGSVAAAIIGVTVAIHASDGKVTSSIDHGYLPLPVATTTHLHYLPFELSRNEKSEMLKIQRKFGHGLTMYIPKFIPYGSLYNPYLLRAADNVIFESFGDFTIVSQRNVSNPWWGNNRIGETKLNGKTVLWYKIEFDSMFPRTSPAKNQLALVEKLGNTNVAIITHSGDLTRQQVEYIADHLTPLKQTGANR